MLKLSKKTEYAFIAVKYMALKRGENASTAREISHKFDISYEFIAKVLQKLSKEKLIESFQGVKGGYSLAKNPEEIALLDIILAVEPHYRITQCMKNDGTYDDCNRWDCCQIRDPLAKVQMQIDKLFQDTKISHIL
ncbi:MAG TPA: Rrf2 family transcriptional regulator [Ignavibacteriaceae bacterium]|nr:Rrf2 family transcriptional regulator [Ignavibacteriaceae bacterium]